MKMTLEDLGWNDFFEKEFTSFHLKGWKPARIIRHHKLVYGALLGDGTEIEVQLSNKGYKEARTNAQLPAVGDWVALELGTENRDNMIRAQLTRQSCLSRKAASEGSEEQVIAANVTIVAVVTNAGLDFNLRRLERYFELIAHSRSKAVVLINKSDLFPDDQNQKVAEAVRALNPEAEVHVTRVGINSELECLKKYLTKGVSIAIIGSSGVGKSSLINQLRGEKSQSTAGINEITGKGRHTTTARELIVLPQGGILIDNPGIKEVQMWADPSTMRERFADIEELAAQCKYPDCKHGTDNGCAIRQALKDGVLNSERFNEYLKQLEEIEKLQSRNKKRQMEEERRSKRGQKARPRNRADRMDLENDVKPRAGD
jgi:ribosome biogenesis GTPase / thiamine phosphate phosphatase